MLANVATLTGLLGTIMGLIQAFDAVANAPADMKQSMLASGISVAMFTTAGGLIVAIPTLILLDHRQRGQQDSGRHGPVRPQDEQPSYGSSSRNVATRVREGLIANVCRAAVLSRRSISTLSVD